MSATDSGPARLGRYVKQRRTQLRLSQASAAKAAHISRPIWANVESGTGTSYDTTYRGVEDALRWVPGTCALILDGGEPVLASPVPDGVPLSRVERARALIEFARTDPMFKDDKSIALILIAKAEEAIREEGERPGSTEVG